MSLTSDIMYVLKKKKTLVVSSDSSSDSRGSLVKVVISFRVIVKCDFGSVIVKPSC
jgi:hypothetical protein